MSEFVSKFILDRYQQGDSQAASELYARYAGRLLRLAKGRISVLLQSKIDAQDVTQESFLAFFELADQQQITWTQEGDLWRLLAGITIKQVQRQAEKFTSAKRSVRSERKFPDHGLHGTDCCTLSGQDDLAVVELTDILDSLFDEKPLAKRILVARLAGYNHTEIGLQVGRNERTVRRILDSIKVKLAGKFEYSLPNARVIETSTHANGNIKEYDLLKLVGAGHFGKSYLGRNVSNQSMVTIKVLKKSWIGDKNAEAILTNEIEQLAKLKSLGVIQTLDSGKLPNGSWFIVTDYFHGKTLRAELESDSVTGERAVIWLKKLATALGELHQHGIAHGDVQPENIIVNEQDAKLIDYGLTTCSSQNRKFRGGTPGFIAPECQTTLAADIYSLGKVIEYVTRKIESVTTSRHLSAIARRMCKAAAPARPTANQVTNLLADSNS